jgi:DNA-binding phage protein
MKNRWAKSLAEYKEIDFDADDVISGIKALNQASVSFVDDLAESIKDDIETQINFINSSLEDCVDSPAVVLRALQIVARAKGLTDVVGDDHLSSLLRLVNLLGLRLSVQLKSK